MTSASHSVTGGTAAKLYRRLDLFRQEVDRQVSFLERMLRARRHPLEFLRLATALLDGFAHAEFPDDNVPDEAKFCRFILQYSSERDVWDRVSVPDMWQRIVHSLAILHGSRDPAAFRWAFVGPDGRPLRTWLQSIGLLQSRRSTRRALALLETALASFAEKDLRKRRGWLYAADQVVQGVCAELKRRRSPDAQAVLRERESLRKLALRFRLPNLLYREVRCLVLHQVVPTRLPEPPRFWRNRRPYWVEVESALVSGESVSIEFPAPFLLQTLRDASARYIVELRQRRELPGEIWHALYYPLENGAVEVLDADRV